MKKWLVLYASRDVGYCRPLHMKYDVTKGCQKFKTTLNLYLLKKGRLINFLMISTNNL